MPTVTMRYTKDGQRVFRIRVKLEGQEFNRTYPGKDDDAIPASWSDKTATKRAKEVAVLFKDECQNKVNDRRSFSEYAHSVLDLKERNGSLKASTLAKYREDVMPRIDNSRLGKKRIKNISVQDLNRFYGSLVNKMTGERLSSSTVRKIHFVISSILKQAAREQIIQNNPAQYATLPRTEKHEANFYTTEQIKDILEAVEHEPLHWRAMTYLLIGIGARRGEVVGLQWRDIDFDNAVISIRRNATIVKGKTTITTTKTEDGRKVSIDPGFLKPLKEWRAEQAALHGGVISLTGFVFAIGDDINVPLLPSSVTRYYARLGERYELGHLNPHAFRHSQASIILQAGDIVTASQRLGHSRTSTTTDIYGHMMPQTDRDAAALVGKVLADVHNG